MFVSPVFYIFRLDWQNNSCKRCGGGAVAVRLAPRGLAKRAVGGWRLTVGWQGGDLAVVN